MIDAPHTKAKRGVFPAVPAGVWALGFVSLCMDISSEMIHSLLPIYMVGVLGVSALSVGIIEGIAEAMRYHSLQITPYAMLSRAIAAQRGNTLVINLPGSEKAARENWEGIVNALGHAGHMMAGEGHDK